MSQAAQRQQVQAERAPMGDEMDLETQVSFCTRRLSFCSTAFSHWAFDLTQDLSCWLNSQAKLISHREIETIEACQRKWSVSLA